MNTGLNLRQTVALTTDDLANDDVIVMMDKKSEVEIVDVYTEEAIIHDEARHWLNLIYKDTNGVEYQGYDWCANILISE